MLFICGTVERNGMRRIFTGETKPTVKHLSDLTGSVTPAAYDWGDSADYDAKLRTAKLMLSCVGDRSSVREHADAFVDEVVSNMDSERMWMSFYGEIEQWLLSKIGRASCRERVYVLV